MDVQALVVGWQHDFNVTEEPGLAQVVQVLPHLAGILFHPKAVLDRSTNEVLHGLLFVNFQPES